MDLSITPDGEGRYVISCPEEMEWDARLDIVTALEGVAGRTAPVAVILDLDNVTYINSAGLGAIFSLRKHVQSSDGKLVLARPSPTIRRLLETVNVQALVPIADDLDEARKLTEEPA